MSMNDLMGLLIGLGLILALLRSLTQPSKTQPDYMVVQVPVERPAAEWGCFPVLMGIIIGMVIAVVLSTSL